MTKIKKKIKIKKKNFTIFIIIISIVTFLIFELTYTVLKMINTPKEKEVDILHTGEVGYLYASIKSISDVHVGDTITLESNPAKEHLPGYKPMKPTVYCGIYPIESSRFEDLREALNKLKGIITDISNDEINMKYQAMVYHLKVEVQGIKKMLHMLCLQKGVIKMLYWELMK